MSDHEFARFQVVDGPGGVAVVAFDVTDGVWVLWDLLAEAGPARRGRRSASEARTAGPTGEACHGHPTPRPRSAFGDLGG